MIYTVLRGNDNEDSVANSMQIYSIRSVVNGVKYVPSLCQYSHNRRLCFFLNECFTINDHPTQTSSSLQAHAPILLLCPSFLSLPIVVTFYILPFLRPISFAFRQLHLAPSHLLTHKI